MRAVCPSCEAVYEVPDRLVGAGRRLRCANCGHQWTLLPAGASEPAAAPPAPPPPEPPPAAPPPAQPKPAPRAEPVPEAPPPPPEAAPEHRQAAPPPAHPMLRRAPQVIDPPLPRVDDMTGRRSLRRGDLALRAAWAGSVLLVALALLALWAFRHEIAGAWPPAARLVGTPAGGG